MELFAERESRFGPPPFIGGSDARVIMGNDEAPCGGYGGRSAARPSRRTSRATSSSSLGLLRRS